MKVWIIILLMLTSTVYAEIYTCEENGRKMFSQQPCGKDAKTVNLQGGTRKVTVDLDNIPQTADDLCSLARGAWDVALASNRVKKKQDRVSLSRIEGYMRERIDNTGELSQRGEDVNKFIRPVALVMQKLVEIEPNPSSEMLNNFKDRCTEDMIRNLENRQRNHRRSSYQNM